MRSAGSSSFAISSRSVADGIAAAPRHLNDRAGKPQVGHVTPEAPEPMRSTIVFVAPRRAHFLKPQLRGALEAPRRPPARAACHPAAAANPAIAYRARSPRRGAALETAPCGPDAPESHALSLRGYGSVSNSLASTASGSAPFSGRGKNETRGDRLDDRSRGLLGRVEAVTSSSLLGGFGRSPPALRRPPDSVVGARYRVSSLGVLP